MTEYRNMTREGKRKALNRTRAWEVANPERWKAISKKANAKYYQGLKVRKAMAGLKRHGFG
jgi:hypothetical protein